MTGAVGGSAGALHGRAFAEFGCVATEGALVNLAFFGARERHAIVVKLVDRFGRFTGEVFHRVRVAQPVRAFDGVVHVPLPAVGPHVAQASGNAALRGNGVRACREYLGDAGSAQALFGHAERRAQPGTTSADHDAVVVVCFVFVSSHVNSLERDFSDGENAGRRRAVAEAGQKNDGDLAGEAMHVILDQHLHAGLEVHERRHNHESRNDRREWTLEIGQNRVVWLAQSSDQK